MRSRDGSSLGLLLVLLFLAAPLSLCADAYLVKPDGTGDFADIQAAVLGIGEGDVILLDSGTFTGPGNRDVSTLGGPTAFTIRSVAGDPALCVIDCEYLGRAFVIGESDVLIQDITITAAQNPAYGGAISSVNNNSVAENCVFTQCVAQYGGAIIVGACVDGYFTARNCTFNMNTATSNGGAVYVEGEACMAMEGCLFFGNNAQYGGAVYLGGSEVSIETCTFHANWSTASGGGVYSMYSGLYLYGCTFSENQAPVGSGLSVEVEGYTQVFNSIVAFGGGIGEGLRWDGSGYLDIVCTDIVGNIGGDWTPPIVAWLPLNDNIWLDPYFCGETGSGNFWLASNSPCAEGNSPCGQMGAWGVDCPPVAVMTSDWSTIKAMY